jgi:mRNA interferase YafQ
MRTIERKKRFKQDYKKLKSGIHAKTIDRIPIEIVGPLIADSPLPERYFDHPRKPNEATLELVRIGSHSELGI